PLRRRQGVALLPGLAEASHHVRQLARAERVLLLEGGGLALQHVAPSRVPGAVLRGDPGRLLVPDPPRQLLAPTAGALLGRLARRLGARLLDLGGQGPQAGLRLSDLALHAEQEPVHRAVHGAREVVQIRVPVELVLEVLDGFAEGVAEALEHDGKANGAVDLRAPHGAEGPDDAEKRGTGRLAVRSPVLPATPLACNALGRPA